MRRPGIEVTINKIRLQGDPVFSLYSMLDEFDMKLVLHQNFYDFFNEHRYNAEDAHLMFRMQAFDKQSVSLPRYIVSAKCV